MTIEFRNRDDVYIKQWPNWTGVIPNQGDTVVIHFGDYAEESYSYEVEERIIDGTKPDKVVLIIDCQLPTN